MLELKFIHVSYQIKHSFCIQPQMKNTADFNEIHFIEIYDNLPKYLYIHTRFSYQYFLEHSP